MPPHTPGTAADTQDEQTDLEQLAKELATHGLIGELCTPPGKLPYLHVRNPAASVLQERVYAQANSFWFSWADRIAGCDELSTAGATLARVLRTVSE